MGLNLYAMQLKFISMNLRYDTLKCVLNTINDAIEEASNNIDKAEKAKDEEYLDSVIDEETAVIEELLGAAFVVCQSYIISIIERFKKLHKKIKIDKLKFTVTNGKKKALLETGSANVASSKYTELEVIDAFANYFKHSDQWPLDWTKADNLSKGTIEIIQSVGAQPGSTGNMRTGAKALGCPVHNNLDSLLDKITQWQNELLKQYQTELKCLGVL